jgi:hypothetical protein
MEMSKESEMKLPAIILFFGLVFMIGYFSQYQQVFGNLLGVILAFAPLCMLIALAVWAQKNY